MHRPPDKQLLVFIGRLGAAPLRDLPLRETETKALIRVALAGALERAGAAHGIAGGREEDILFHEACDELSIDSEVCLALPPDEFIEAVLAATGSGWVERFLGLVSRRAMRILPASRRLTESYPNRMPWQEYDRWMLEMALARRPEDTTVIALCDGASGGDRHASGDMLDRVRAMGARVDILNTGNIVSPQG